MDISAESMPSNMRRPAPKQAKKKSKMVNASFQAGGEPLTPILEASLEEPKAAKPRPVYGP